jgi:hypothetical protein
MNNRSTLFTVALLSVLSLSAFASENEDRGDPCTYFERNPKASEHDQFKASMSCTSYKGPYVLSALDELAKFSDGTILRELKKHYVTILNLYPKFIVKCSQSDAQSSAECRWFNEKVQGNPHIRIACFHATLMMGDVDLAREWIRTMPVYDVNKAIHIGHLSKPKYRFTFAELAAGHPHTSLEMLKLLNEENLLDFNSDESFPLHRAIVNRKIDRIKYLIDIGYDLNVHDTKNYTHYYSEKDLQFFSEMEGQTPLMHAVAYQDVAIVDLLLKQSSINVNAKAFNGDNALGLALNNAMFSYLMLPEDRKNSLVILDRFLGDSRFDVMSCGKGNTLGFHTLVQGYAYQYAPIEFSMLIDKYVNHPKFDADFKCSEKSTTAREYTQLAIQNINNKQKRKYFKNLARSL